VVSFLIMALWVMLAPGTGLGDWFIYSLRW
jgi:hypothetical protein